VGTIAVAAPKQPKVIAFDAGELGRVLQWIAAVGTCGMFYVVHDLPGPSLLAHMKRLQRKKKRAGLIQVPAGRKGAVPQSRTRQQPIRQRAVLPLAGGSRF
jgi:hypothetical protein